MSTTGKAIDEIAKLQLKRDKLQAQVAAAEREINLKKDKLLSRLQKSKLDGAAGSLGRCAVVEEDIPNIEDFEKLCAYAAKTKDWDLLQRRISKAAWEERVADGKKVPGVKVFHRVSLRVAPIKVGRK